jgi:hypothetical protein
MGYRAILPGTLSDPVGFCRVSRSILGRPKSRQPPYRIRLVFKIPGMQLGNFSMTKMRPLLTLDEDRKRRPRAMILDGPAR